MKKEYRLFISKVILFIIIFMIVDFLIGSVILNSFFNQKSGKYARIMHSIKNTEADILIFGSSAANHHYIPQLFEKGLNQSTYNVGVQGQYIIFFLALQELILERLDPKVIILNVDSRWLNESQDAYDRLHDLHPYYWDYYNILKPILSLNSRFIDFKLLFKTYQTNSTHLHMIYYYFSPQADFQGYKPLYGNFKKLPDVEKESKNRIKLKEREIDQNFVNAFSKFISNAKNKNIKLIFSVSPTIFGVDIDSPNNNSMMKLKEIAELEKIPLYDFSNDARFKNRDDLFFTDGVHLNDEGAQLLSNLLIEKMKDSLPKEDGS